MIEPGYAILPSRVAFFPGTLVPVRSAISGSLGTLVGADLLNLGQLRVLGAPVASIGGAGKFDGVFLTGIVAVLLAGILGGRWRVPPRLQDARLEED